MRTIRVDLAAEGFVISVDDQKLSETIPYHGNATPIVQDLLLYNTNYAGAAFFDNITIEAADQQ